MAPNQPGSSTITEKERALELNALYRHGEGKSLHILQTDMGVWPPQGLNIALHSKGDVHFEPYFKPHSLTSAYVDFTTTAGIIYINTAHYLRAKFNKASRALADTIAHENLHVLQKRRMKSGISDPMGRNRDYELTDYLRKRANTSSRYLCHRDETQVRLHQIVAQYHRYFRKMPLNTAELYTLLDIERVKINSPWVTALLASPQGILAKAKFNAASHQSDWLKPQPIQDMEQIFAAIDKTKRDEYCQTIFPAIFGQLLEIYGDSEGSRRVGYNHNLTLTEFFFRQAWNLQHRWKENRQFDMRLIQKIIAVMPQYQAEDLMDHLIESRPYTHPVLKRELQLEPDAAWKIIPYLSGRASASPDMG